MRCATWQKRSDALPPKSRTSCRSIRCSTPGPVGTYVLQVCGTLSCALLGAERVVDELTAALGVGVGETDPTGTFTLQVVECLGACDRAPLVMVNDEWHERQRPEQVGELLDALRARGLSAVSGCHLKVAGER